MSDPKFNTLQKIGKSSKYWVIFFVSLGILWSLVIAASLFKDTHQQNEYAYEAAKVRAIEALNKDLIYRRWVARHGGVYVPESDYTPPNPYLTQIDHRDIVSNYGEKLTLVNPAYMTRQVYEMAKEQYGVLGHITSLDPIRPENKPDEWERNALLEFEKGIKEVNSISKIDNEPYIRIMIPLKTEESCLQCHREQGYKLGDMRGGISTSSPLKPHLAIAKTYNRSLAISHITIMLIGLAGISTCGFYIMKRNKSEQQAIEEVRKYASIAASSSDIMTLIDKDFKYLAVNDAFVNAFGVNREEVINRSPAEVLNLDYFRNNVKPSAELCMREHKEVHFESWFDFPNQSRRYLLITYSPYIDSNNNTQGFSVNAKDITKQKQAEEIVKDYNIKLERLVSERTAKLEEEIKVRINAEQELKAATAHLIQSEKLSTIGQLAASMAHEINNPLGAICSSNNIIKHKFSELIENFDTEFYTYSQNKEITNYVLNSIPEQKQYISSKEARQKRKTIEEELNSIGIENAKEAADFLVRIGITEELEGVIPLFKCNDREKIMEFILRVSDIIDSKNIIDTAISQSIKVIQALKDYSRSTENQKPAKTNIKETIETTLILYGNKIRDGIELVTIFYDVPDIIGYSHELSQVWTNIIQNSIQAMDQTGKITISLGQTDNNIEVKIEDTGKGIPEEIQEKIFEPMFTTKGRGEGTGLGLDIAKKIIEKHNGTIKLKSTKGQGTTFTITFPCNSVELETVG